MESAATTADVFAAITATAATTTTEEYIQRSSYCSAHSTTHKRGGDFRGSIVLCELAEAAAAVELYGAYVREPDRRR